eukprot:2631616-Amphidinium_carterae.1
MGSHASLGGPWFDDVVTVQAFALSAQTGCRPESQPHSLSPKRVRFEPLHSMKPTVTRKTVSEEDCLQEGDQFATIVCPEGQEVRCMSMGLHCVPRQQPC